MGDRAGLEPQAGFQRRFLLAIQRRDLAIAMIAGLVERDLLRLADAVDPAEVIAMARSRR